MIYHLVNTLRPRQNWRHFADDIFKCIFLNENVWIPIKISLKFVPQGPINNIPALVQKMAWRQPGAKPLSEPMMVSLLTHIYVTRPQWVKSHYEIWGSQMHLFSTMFIWFIIYNQRKKLILITMRLRSSTTYKRITLHVDQYIPLPYSFMPE